MIDTIIGLTQNAAIFTDGIKALFSNGIAEGLSSLIWGPWTVGLVLLAGLWLSSSCGWLQVAGLRTWWRSTIGSMRGSGGRGSGGISSFRTTTAALAGTLGTGNIVGVAAALTAGGAGAIFWMWVAGLLGMMTAYAENVLGIVYRRKGADGEWLGGPMLYMANGLGASGMASVWAVLCAVAAFGVGNLTQVNSIAVSASASWGVPGWVTGVVVMAAAAPAILGGVRSVSALTERLIPIMTLAYMLACVAVLAVNFGRIPAAFGDIFAGVVSPRAVGGGALGALLVGVRRGVFTNEAGLGSSVLIHSTADVKHPAIQGMWGIFEVFADTLVMCTVTALVILTSGAMDIRTPDGAALEGASLSAAAFSQVFGRFSGSFVTIALLLFAFATVVGWSCCGERAFSYLCGSRYVWVYKAAYVLAVLPGALVQMRTLWALSDLLNGLMAIPNTIAVILLWRVVREQTADFGYPLRLRRRRAAVRTVQVETAVR